MIMTKWHWHKRKNDIQKTKLYYRKVYIIEKKSDDRSCPQILLVDM